MCINLVASNPLDVQCHVSASAEGAGRYACSMSLPVTVSSRRHFSLGIKYMQMGPTGPWAWGPRWCSIFPALEPGLAAGYFPYIRFHELTPC